MEDLDETAAARVGQTVDGTWTLERLLGVGGMAAVYAARDAGGATAAVKMLHPEMGLKRDVRERFWREAYAANRVEHPGAVQVLGHGTDANHVAYLVMELLEGEPLSARAARHGVLPVGELLEYTDQILDVLAAAHERGIVHRDLKPDNLFITTDGKVKVLDFGVARFVRDAPSDFKTRTGTALGTLPYMAPEQALGRSSQIDGRTDLFSIGATLFRILSGRKVHEADSDAEILMAMASKSAPPLRTAAPDVPEHVCAIVDLALAFSRDARYPDARTMQGDVQAARAGKTPPYAVGQNVVGAREAPTIVEAPAAAATASMDSPPPSSTTPDRGLSEAPLAPAPTPVATAATVPAAGGQHRRPGLGVMVALSALVLLLLGGTVAAAVLLLRPGDRGPAAELSGPEGSPTSEQGQGTSPTQGEPTATPADAKPTAPEGGAAAEADSAQRSRPRSPARLVREDPAAPADTGSGAALPAAPRNAESPAAPEESGQDTAASPRPIDVPTPPRADAPTAGSPSPGPEATEPPARPRHGSRRPRNVPRGQRRH